MELNEENTAAAARTPSVEENPALFVPEEPRKESPASGATSGGGRRKGSNKVVIVIWVTILLGGISLFAYSQQKKAAEADRLLNEAFTLYNQQEFARSTELLRQSAELGSAWAQLYYGERLKNGFYAEPDAVEAVKWLRKSAKQNCPEAFFQLGTCYENGEGVDRDLSEAEMWYRKALADPGSAYLAQTALERIESLKAKSGEGND